MKSGVKKNCNDCLVRGSGLRGHHGHPYPLPPAPAATFIRVDAIVILSGIILGPACGFLAGGVGSALADLLGGYFFYVPITLVIKGLIAFLSAVLYRKVNARGKTPLSGSHPGRNRGYPAGLPEDISYASPFSTGPAGALASVPANLIQGGQRPGSLSCTLSGADRSAGCEKRCWPLPEAPASIGPCRNSAKVLFRIASSSSGVTPNTILADST